MKIDKTIPGTKDETAVLLVKAIVARGHTVAVSVTALQVPLTDADGEPIPIQVRAAAREVAHFGPGQEVELPWDEVVRLRQLGFLEDPDAQEIPRGIGPRYPGDVGMMH